MDMNVIKTETEFCRLCENAIDDEDYREIDDASKEILNFVLMSMELDASLRHLICSRCYEKLYAAFNFKSSCCYINNVISTYANCTDVTTVDLKEVYLSEKEKKLSITLSEDQKVCRLCLELTNCGFKPVKELQEDAIDVYIPEINFTTTVDPIICETCIVPLRNHSSFIKQCLSNMNQISTKKDRTTITSTHPYIKIEEIEIKLEKNDVQLESMDMQNKEAKYNFESIQEYDLKEQISEREDFPEKDKLHKCDVCDYKTKYKTHLTNHVLVHKDPSEIDWFKCDECDYKAKIKSSLKEHMLQHKDFSEIQWYKCDVCDHRSKTKSILKRHTLRHKNSSEVRWYKCDTCDFSTKYKSNFNQHMLGHKDPSEVHWYKCDECDYKTKIKKCLKLHLVQHKDPAEIHWYRCNECDYKAKVKQLLRIHMIEHKDPSEIQWHKCDTCDYKTKNVYLLKAHELIHKNPSEIRWYKCDLCDYKSKTNSALRKHTLRHKDPSEIKLKHKCDMCDYMTKYKSHLRRHSFIHKKSSGTNVE